jgi:hypothetical protein
VDQFRLGFSMSDDLLQFVEEMFRDLNGLSSRLYGSFR